MSGTKPRFLEPRNHNQSITDDEIRQKLAETVAEFTSGLRGAIPEQDDYAFADQTLKNLEAYLSRPV